MDSGIKFKSSDLLGKHFYPLSHLHGSAFWIAFLSQQSVFNDLPAPVSPGGRETRDHDRWKNKPREAE